MGHQTRRNTFFHLDSQTEGWAPTWSELMHPCLRVFQSLPGYEQAPPAAQTLDPEPTAITWHRRPYITSFGIKCTVKSEPPSRSTDGQYIQAITTDLDTSLKVLGHGHLGPDRLLYLRLHTERPVSPGEYFLIVADRYHLFQVLPNQGTGIPAVLCLPTTLEESNSTPSYRKMGIGLLEWCHDIDNLKMCKDKLYSALGITANMLDTMSERQLAEDFPNPSSRPYSIFR